MPPPDGMENTSKKREAHKRPVDKMSVNKTSVNKASVNKASFGEMSVCETSFGEMAMSFDTMSLALDKPLVDKSPPTPVKSLALEKTPQTPKMSLALEKTPQTPKMSLALEKTPQTPKMSLALDKAFVDKTPQTRATLKPPRPTEPTACTEKSKPRTGPGFMDLPYKIRKQIRYEALLVDSDRGKPFLTSNLATVAKEWRDDIEEVIFNDITIDTLDEQEVLAFKEMFATDKRRRLLTRLNFAIDDSETGPWYEQEGVVEIARIMASIGNFLQYINGWNFRKEGGGWRPLEIVFASSQFPDARIDWSRGGRLVPDTSSLWEPSSYPLEDATGNQSNLISLPLRAVSSTFPSSLNMVTHLSIPADCVPMSAAETIMQTLPNLETVVLDLVFSPEYGDAWTRLTDLIDLLHDSAPSLHSLTLRNPFYSYYLSEEYSGMSRDVCVEDSMRHFSSALRDCSQGLKNLTAYPFELDFEFYRPFSPIAEHVYSKTWVWPQLQHLDLDFFDENAYPSANPKVAEYSIEYKGESTQQAQPPTNYQASGVQHALYGQEASGIQRKSRNQHEIPPNKHKCSVQVADVLIAAGRATVAMPILESAHISVWSLDRGDRGIFAKRKLCPKTGSTASSRVWIYGDTFVQAERSEIMAAWAPFLGPDPKIDEDLMSEFEEPYEVFYDD